MPYKIPSSLWPLLLVISIGVGVASVRAQMSHTLLLPAIYAPPMGNLLIAAAHIDSALTGEADEAILLWNASRSPIDLAQWTIEVNGRKASFPAANAPQLQPGERIWCADEAASFLVTFGQLPDCEWGADSDLGVLNLDGATLQLNNAGGVIYLRDAQGQIVDTLLYGNNAGPAIGWQGAPVQLYARGALGKQGQVWQRKIVVDAGTPVDDDQASDWASDLADVELGRRVRFPGWGGWIAEDGALPTTLIDQASITVAIAPEGLYTPIANAIDNASQTLDLSLYTFEHPELAQHIANAAQRGVKVRMLLEGGPPGGITDFQRWCVRLMAQAGVDVRYLAAQDNAPRGLQPRYRYIHAKYGIVDGQRILIGTENFSWDAMPIHNATPAGGRRGAYLFVDSQTVADAFAKLFAADWSPDRFSDLQPYVPTHAQYGDPAPDYALPLPPTYVVQDALFADSLSGSGETHFQLITAPENVLTSNTGLNALIQRASAGDEIYLMQLYEHKYWYLWSQPIKDARPKTDTEERPPSLLPQLQA